MTRSTKQEKALQDLVELTEEFGLYDDEMPRSAADGVKHYDLGDGIEAQDVIDAFISLDSDGREFNLGCALKYLLRLGKKGPARQDVIKAYDNWYRWWYGKWPKKNPFKEVLR